jgi:hypothetical protein
MPDAEAAALLGWTEFQVGSYRVGWPVRVAATLLEESAPVSACPRGLRSYIK